MDCKEPVNDLCDVWEAQNLKITKKTNSSKKDDVDMFFITLEIETVIKVEDEDENEDEDEDLEAEEAEVFTFWAPCPRLERKNLTNKWISEMLTKAGVPRHKQEFMVHKISKQADVMAANANKDKQVLPMMVLISMVACLCHGESVEDN